MELREGDIYICKVKKLLQHGIIVTVGNSEKEGFIHISELSKRWVSDVKDVVKEGDIIVCKVITLDQSPELSVKRVTDSEKKEALKEWSIENRLMKLIEKFYKKDTEKLKDQIIKKYGSIYGFYEAILKNGKSELDELKFNNEVTSAVIDFVEKTKRKIVIKNQLEIKTNEENGIEKIKELIDYVTKKEGISVRYIKAPVYLMTVDMGDTKKTINENKKVLEELSKKSKELGIEFKYTEIRQ